MIKSSRITGLGWSLFLCGLAANLACDVCDGSSSLHCISYPVSYAIAGCATDAVQQTAAVDGTENESTESWARLSDAGFDLTLLDDIRARNSQALSSKDGAPMENLQSIVGQWEENGFGSIAPLGLLDLLSDTRNSVCRRVRMVGRVRQCLRIRIKTDSETTDDSADSNDLFQLTIFPDLDGKQITVKTPEGKRVPYGRFSVTVRASSLPAGETASSLLDQRVRVDGFHYRFWRYDSVFSGQHGLNGQVGALVISGPIEIMQAPSVAILEDGIMWAVTLLAIGLLAMVWWYGRSKSINDRTYDALPDMLPEDWKSD